MSSTSTSTVRWLVRVLPAVTFLVGIVVGGLIVGLSGIGDGSGDSNASDPAEPTSSIATGDTNVAIPAACSKASDVVAEAVQLLRGGAAAVRDFQPDVLVKVLGDLETLDPELRKLAAQCSAVDITPGPTEASETTE